MNVETVRVWLIRWMYAAALVHLLVGLALPWIDSLPIFETYHRGIEAAFWGTAAPAAAREQQLWWIALFGPTMQSLSLWMATLVYFGSRYRSRVAWGMLVAGIAIWAPQDMLISLRADCWTHVWVDCFAVATMLPPMLGLWWLDCPAAAASHAPYASNYKASS